MPPLFDPYRQFLPLVSEREERLYERYYALLKEWNEKINLVSRKSFDQVVAGQFIDCVQILDLTHSYIEGLDVLDIGSGGGFPGLLFAIRNPETPITLYEKIGKKRDFLAAVIRELSLSNAKVKEGFFRKAKGFVFARAVFSGEEYFSFFREHLITGSRLVRNLGGSTVAEKAAEGFRLIVEKRYLLPEDHGSRVLQIFERST